jgi:HEAT repeat protein
VDAFEAAKAVWEDSDERLERPLILTLKNGRRPFNRVAAAFAMQMVTTPKTMRALESVVKNKSECPRVRGEAAEALAHRHREKSHDVLLAGLGDSSKDVRFWCAFALGEMAEKRAIPSLKRLVATDKRIVKGFHSVAKEAADAIENIQTEKIAHRRKIGWVFCVRD